MGLAHGLDGADSKSSFDDSNKWVAMSVGMNEMVMGFFRQVLLLFNFRGMSIVHGS